MSLQVTLLTDHPFGAHITLPNGITDPSLLGEEDFALLKAAVHTHLVVIIPNQAQLSPNSQYLLTQRFDETCKGNYGHKKELFLHKDSVLSKDGKLIPCRPEVVRVGQGKWTVEELEAAENFESDTPCNLEHPMHHTFHKELLTEEEKNEGQTRFFRWHIDAALYDLNPPMVTTLLGLVVPKSDEKQFIKYTDAPEQIKHITKGSTAFASGQIAYELLSAEDKKFVQTHSVVYAPHPYIFISKCRATSDGLTIVSDGQEKSFEDLPEYEESKIKTLPFVWTNPTTKKAHLQVHSCCVWRIVSNITGEVVAEMEEARKICQKLMRPAISPENVYAHAWTRGDLAIFFNRGVIHSVTSEFLEEEKRLMHQCNIASGVLPTNESADIC